MSTINGVEWDGVARGYIPDDQLTISPSLKLHTAGDVAVDPITFEVIRYSLLNTNIEHGKTLQRLCVSPITMLTRDFQPSITMENGDLVFLGPYLQYFSNCQSLTIKWILENRSDSPGIEPGDMFLSNDPYVGSPHQPDAVVAAPVFVGDELFCWVANVLNHADVGGNDPGSFCTSAEDMFTDPPAIPPVKLVSRGKVQADVEQMFLRQSRLPTQVHMDLRAAISANLLAVEKITGLIDRYGADSVKAVMSQVLDAGEETFVERLRQVPDGVWSHRTYAEGRGLGDDGIYAYQLTVRKEGDYIYVDNEGTDPQTGSINIAYAALIGAFLSTLTASMTADLGGAYGGVYRRVKFNPTPGTLSCADFPAAVSPAGVYTIETVMSLSGAVISKMLGCAAPEVQKLAIGPANPAFYGLITGGEVNGAPFIAANVNNMIGGLSATPAGDGVDFGGHFWIPEGEAGNVEDLEQLWPMLFLYRRALPVRADGAGKYRGGRGFIEATIPWGVPGIGAVLYVDESFPRLIGPFGANPGTIGRFQLKRGTDVAELMRSGEVPDDFEVIDGEREPVQAKGPMLMIGADDMWEWTGANGVGFGDPLTRELADVGRDVARCGLTPEIAARVYGVVVGHDGEVDVAGSEKLRAELLDGRLAAATAPVSISRVPDDATLRRIGGDLGVVERDGVAQSFATVAGRVILSSVDADFKTGCAVRECRTDEVGPEYEYTPGRAGRQMVYREYLCPVSGIRIDSEVVRDGERLPAGIRLGADLS